MVGKKAISYISFNKLCSINPYRFFTKSKNKEFVSKLSNWNNTFNLTLLKKAQQDILKNNHNTSPKILDPFAGGGSIPLEALRLGCDTYASDYNPVATLILKCILEFPNLFSKKDNKKNVVESKYPNNLAIDVEKWGHVILEQMKKELSLFMVMINLQLLVTYGQKQSLSKS